MPYRFIGAIMLAGLVGLGSAQAQDRVLTFRDRPAGDSGMKLIGANAEKLVAFEPEGMCIRLPAPKYHAQTGLSTGLRVQGDFEITLNFEILKEAPPTEPVKGASATRLLLYLALDRPEGGNAGIARKITAARGSTCLGWTTLPDDDAGGPKTRSTHDLATDAKTGRLRLTRTGSELGFYFSDGPAGEFRLLKQLPFTKDDVKDIQVTANTGGRGGTLEARVSQLVVRMNPGQAAAQPDAIAAPPADPGPSSRLPLALLLGLAFLMLVALALGLVIFAWQRRRAASTSEAAAVDDD